MTGLDKLRYRGLTLTEVVVALMILGMLYVIFGGSMNFNLNKVDSSVVESRFEEIRVSLDTYFVDQSDIPTDLESVGVMLGMEVEEIGALDGVKKYRTVNSEDTWGNRYQVYVYNGDENNSKYLGIVSSGPDGDFSDNIEDVGDDIMLVYYPIN